MNIVCLAIIGTRTNVRKNVKVFSLIITRELFFVNKKKKKQLSKLRPARDWEILNFTKLIQHYNY
jgi:hypothetical protein